MEKQIIEENGLRYTLGADGMYYPDLKLTEGTNYPIGRYGRMRGEFLMKERRSMYLELLLAGKWNLYLHELDMECYQRMEDLVEQMKAELGITEELKKVDWLEWVGRMNCVKCAAEEFVLKELIFI